jgi:adenylate cyclase
LPERAQGAALFADISGFTPLTEALAAELGPKRGAEELTRHLNQVYDALVAELHRYGGSVISFAGDAITCWLDGDDGARATACALAMHQAMEQFASVTTASGRTVSLAMKAAVTSGPVCRFLVGDPGCCVVDVLAGRTLDRLAAAEHLAARGETLLTPETAQVLGDRLRIQAWRQDEAPVLSRGGETGERFAVAASLAVQVPESPWPPLPPAALSEDQVRPWLLPPVWQRLQSDQGEFLAELRPAVALFLRFGGIDYDCDPAALDKLDTFIRGVQRTVLRYEGSLLQLTIGDKGSYLYVAFGAPVAHEDDAIRAASAALELQRLTAGLDYLTDFQIGIAQGRMRTGAYGSHTRRTYGVLGDAVNLSARLMSAAGPGQILAGDRARVATGDKFDWERLPALQLKGKTEPVAVSRLVGLRADRAIRLLEPRYTLPMVGREAELALIAQKVDLVLHGRGQIVGFTGEAGMGKSRLAAEAIRVAREKELVIYGGECQSYGTTTSYLVWQRIWRSLLGLDAAAPLDEQVRSLEGSLSQIDPALLPRLPLLGPVLNLPIPDNDLTHPLDSKVRKSSLEALLVDCLAARAGQGPLLLVLEDCHWLDPLSHELIEVIGRAILGLPVLMLMIYRPPDARRLQAPRVSLLPHFTEIVLAEFTAKEAERLIRLKLAQVFGPELELAPDLIARIATRAAGNPFYIEELLNYLHDRGVDPRDRVALAQVDLPSSLYSLILSRMDQLTESQRATIRVASVIGRLFPAAMVWGVYRQLGTREQVSTDLQVLSELDLTPLEAAEPELAYLFKHIVTQEVAYESLLYATRAMLHEQIGLYLERTHGETLHQYTNLLAFHYEHSQNEDKKREYLLKAGEAAQKDYANEAAIEYYDKALPLLAPHDRVPVHLKLGKVLEMMGQWPEAGDQYGQVLALAGELGDRPGQAWGETAFAELCRKQGQFGEAEARLDRARALFEELGDPEGSAQVLHYGGTLAAQQGEYERARTLYEESLAIRRSLGNRPQSASLLSNLGIVARFQGDYALARSLHEQSLAIRRELGDRWAIGVSLNNLGNVALDQGQYAQARALHEEGLAIRRQVGDRWAIGNALNNLGNLARTQAEYGQARALYDEALSIYRVLGDKWALAYLFEDVGCLVALQGQAEAALRLAGAASTLRQEIGAPLSPTEKNKLEEVLAPARQALGKEAAAAAQTQGQAMPLEEAIELAMSGS